MASARILLIPLVKGFVVTTEGSTPIVKTRIDLDVPQVRHLLPQLDALFLIGYVDGVAANTVDCGVEFFSGLDRNHESSGGPFDIGGGTPICAPTSVRLADYVTIANFMPESRLQLWWSNHTAITGLKTAALTVVLGARYLAA